MQPIVEAVSEQTWLEYIWRRRPPADYALQFQYYGTTVAAAAGAQAAQQIQVPQPFYCFGVRSLGWLDATGNYSPFPYRLSIANAAGNNWTGATGPGALVPASGIISGDWGNGNAVEREWVTPRELARNDVITVNVDNRLGAGNITTDVVLFGYEPRRRTSRVDGAPNVVPQTWLEWIWALYPPDKYVVQPQWYNTTVAAIAATQSNPGTIQPTQKFYCFEISSKGWATAAGGSPAFPYRISAGTNDNGWTGGTGPGTGAFASGLITGDWHRGQVYPRRSFCPREMEPNEVLNFNVDNTLNAAGTSVDISLFGYTVVQRGLV